MGDGLRAPICGGNVYNGSLCGLFALNVNNAPSNSNWNYGASHSYRLYFFNAHAFPHV